MEMDEAASHAAYKKVIDSKIISNYGPSTWGAHQNWDEDLIRLKKKNKNREKQVQIWENTKKIMITKLALE